MNTRRYFGYGFILIALAIFGGQWREHQGARTDSPTISGSFYRQVAESFLSADFDGDNKPDLAVGKGGVAGYSVQIHFTGLSPDANLIFPSGGPGIRITTRDVDQDSDQDIVVTSITSDIPIAIWLNDGKGHFEKADSRAIFPQGLRSPLQFQPEREATSLLALLEDDTSSMGTPCGTSVIPNPGFEAFLSSEAGFLLPPGNIFPSIARGPPVNSPRFS